jgi:hypothetical protein
MSRTTLRKGSHPDENRGMNTAAHRVDHCHPQCVTRRPGGLWDALVAAVVPDEEEPSRSRRRLAALRLQPAYATADDFADRVS